MLKENAIQILSKDSHWLKKIKYIQKYRKHMLCSPTQPITRPAEILEFEEVNFFAPMDRKPRKVFLPP